MQTTTLKNTAALIFLMISAIPLSIAAEFTCSDSENCSANLLFLGDTNFGESYQLMLKAQGKGNVLEIEGYDYTIDKFKQILKGASLVVGNLETPITNIPYSPLVGKKRYIHFGDVQGTINTLKKNHFGLLSLANNHAMDYGISGLTQTLDLTRQSEIHTCGAGGDEKEAAQPYLQSFDFGSESLNIAILCAYKYVKKYDYVYKYYASEQQGGVYKLDVKKLKEQIASLKNKENTLVILYLHWGKNYKFASDYQIENGRELVDAGADIVLGHGAHFLQEIELRNNKWIIYNLGNFVFNSPGRYKKNKAHPFSLLASIRIEKNDQSIRKSIRLYPIFTDNLVTHYQSRFVTSLEFKEVGDILRSRSNIPGGFLNHVSNGKDQHGEYLEIKVQ